MVGAEIKEIVLALDGFTYQRIRNGAHDLYPDYLGPLSLRRV